MSETDKFLKLFGGIFFACGVLLFIIGIFVFGFEGAIIGWLVPLGMSLVFMAIGGGILLYLIKKSLEKKKIIDMGDRYSGKIYGYLEDKSCVVNGDFLINIKVRYFDKMGIEREAVIPTGFTRGSGQYPIGATIDIMVLDNKATWDKNSVRYERIDREDELMDNKPLDPKLIDMVAVNCPSCGASFSAAKGYVSNCPYCGRAINS